MKQYNSYKKTKFPFLEDIPVDWNDYKNRELFYEYKSKNMNNLDLLSVSQQHGIIKQLDLKDKKDNSNEDKSNYKHVLPGDIVYNKMRMWQGAVGSSDYEGVVSPAYVVLRSLNTQIVSSEYIHYLFRSPLYIAQSNQYSYGLCDDMNNLRYEDFKSMVTFLPPFEEQKRIVNYVKRIKVTIDKFINKKKKYIELLKEYKQSVINELVTKGIDPNVKMKDSGIEWIGQIPEHWEIRRLRNFIEVNPLKKNFKFKSEDDEQVTFLPMELIYNNGSYKNLSTKKISEVSNGYTYFERGDIVLAKITPCFENRKSAYLKDLRTDFGFGTTELHILRVKKNIFDEEYLYYIINSDCFIKNGTASMKGSAGQQRVPENYIKNYMLAIPPMNEQKQIVSVVKKYENEIEVLISKSQRQIDLIKEYRESLIYEVVTGKRMV